MLIDILLFGTGIVVGALNAVAGGGIVGYPILLAVGLHPLIADATSYVAALPGHLSSAWGYRHYLRRIPRLYILLLLPCALGAAVGAHFLRLTSVSDFDHLVPILVLIAVSLSLLQPIFHIHLMDHLRRRHRFNLKFLVLILASFILMIYGGFFGVGISFSLLTSVGLTKVRDLHMMNGMKNIAAVVVIIVAILSISSANLIHWHYGLVIGGGSLLGGYFGSRAASNYHLPLRAIRAIAITIGVATIAYLLVKYH